MIGCITMSTMGCTNLVLQRELPAHPVPFRVSNYADEYRSEDAYTTAVTQLFRSLDRLESALSESSTPYLLSSPTITEADVRLYTTIIRFDPVYVQHFKCNIRDIRSGYVNNTLEICYLPLTLRQIPVATPLDETFILGRTSLWQYD